MIRTELSLLDAIAIEMRCEYLSDLRYLARQPPEATAETAKERLIQALSRPR